MALLIVSIYCILTLYVYYLQRSLIWVLLKKSHSKSYLKRAFRSSSKVAKITGFYLYIDKNLRKGWLLAALIFANLNLLDIPILIFYRIYRDHMLLNLARLLGLKDFMIIFLVLIAAKKLSSYTV